MYVYVSLCGCVHEVQRTAPDVILRNVSHLL